MPVVFTIVNPVIKSIVGNIDAMTSPGATMGMWIVNLITFFIGIAGLYFLVMLILGGYGFITAGSDKDGVQKATARIRNALIGISIVLSVYTIMWIVEALFGVSIRSFNFPTI